MKAKLYLACRALALDQGGQNDQGDECDQGDEGAEADQSDLVDKGDHWPGRYPPSYFEQNTYSCPYMRFV